MAVTPTENTSGSQTATLSTDHTLATITTAGIYQLRVDTTNLVTGETLFVEVQEKVRTGDGYTTAFKQSFAGSTSEDTIVLIPWTVVWGVKFIIRQEGGTGRAFPWSIFTW